MRKRILSSSSAEESLPGHDWLDLDHLAQVIERRAEGLQDTVTTGRTHLMDAMPVTLGQVLGAWAERAAAAKANGRALPIAE